ncbi:MAG: RidA family protein [Pseudomonadota bacterium]
MLEIAHHLFADGPKPVAPYSHAVVAGDFLFLTGQMPSPPNDPSIVVPGGIEAETVQVMENLSSVLAKLGSSLDRAVMVRVFLTHFEEDYAAMNAVYERYFAPDKRPARTCVGVTGLAVGARVEIDLIAAR